MATSDGSTSSSESFPAEPLQPRSFHFPKREFGKMTVVKRSFKPGWFDRYKWLHYNKAKDAGHVCRCAADQKRLKTSHKDATFIYKGFQNWKDGTVSLSRHESSDCHKESVQSMIVRPRTTRDIGEQLSEIHLRDKKDNRQLLLKILQNIRFLGYCIKR